jgi:hypothetical protein
MQRKTVPYALPACQVLTQQSAAPAQGPMRREERPVVSPCWAIASAPKSTPIATLQSPCARGLQYVRSWTSVRSTVPLWYAQVMHPPIPRIPTALLSATVLSAGSCF